MRSGRSSGINVVQFIHPGGEHRPDSGKVRSWNDGAHLRKFMKVPGRYVDDRDAMHQGDIVFWGEWEAQARVLKQWESRAGFPRYLFDPFYEIPSTYAGLQNTDPFVFGDHFLYTGCQQHTNRGRSETFLRWMDSPSLVLFGSCIGRSKFVLDTAFVVSSFIDHSKADYKERLSGTAPRAYEDVTLRPWYQGPDSGQSYRLYVGANIEDQAQEMYSFFPCAPSASGEEGFRKPIIDLPGLVTPQLTQGKKGTRVSAERVRQVWREVRRQILEQDLALGVHAALPPKTPSRP